MGTEQVKAVDYTPYSPGDPIPPGAVRTVNIGGSMFTTTDNVTFTPAGGGVTPATDFFASLAAPATTLVLSGLNGNAAGDYLIDGCAITNNAPNQNLQLLVNGATTNLKGTKWDIAVFGQSVGANWLWSNTGPYGFSVGTTFTFMGRLSARTGRIRQIHIAGLTNDSFNDVLSIYGQWTDTTTNLTSLTLSAANVNGLAAGSYLRLTPLNTNA